MSNAGAFESDNGETRWLYREVTKNKILAALLNGEMKLARRARFTAIRGIRRGAKYRPLGFAGLKRELISFRASSASCMLSLEV